MMGPYVEVILVILLPTAVGYAIIGGIRVTRWAAQRRLVAQFSQAPAYEPIERLAARLRRLRAELDALQTGTNIPAKQLRLHALRGAYLDLLAAACDRLEAPLPPRGYQVPQAEIYRAEAALHDRGLDVR